MQAKFDKVDASAPRLHFVQRFCQRSDVRDFTIPQVFPRLVPPFFQLLAATSAQDETAAAAGGYLNKIQTTNRKNRRDCPIAMTDEKEIEVKLELPGAAAARLAELPAVRDIAAPPKRSVETSVYFDTAKHKLRKHGLTLRVRQSDGHYLQTIKAITSRGIIARDEWESEIDGPDPVIKLAAGTPLERIVGGKRAHRLRPLFETRVRRTVYPLRRNSSAIALTLDRGTIDTGKSSMPLCEIELELQRGDEADLFGFARELAHTLPAQLAVSSKADRGYRLVDGTVAMPVKFVPALLAEGLRVRDGFKRIGHACLEQIVGNEPALLKGDPEGVHQMRVGIRRLRAAISLFSGLLRDKQTAVIKDELKWLIAELAPARELHVLMKRVVAPVKKQRADRDGLTALTRRFADSRAGAVARAQEAVRSERFRRLTLDVAAWLEGGEWVKSQDDLVRDRGEMPIETLAREQLARRRRKIRKRRKSFATLSARRRHKLRIQAKKLRYAVEFFADLYSGNRTDKRRKKIQAAIEWVQDALGDLNDIAVHEKLIATTGMRQRQMNRNGVFAAGLLTGREDARLTAAMATASDALSHFAAVEPFWK